MKTITSGQDGDIGRHTLPPHATTERITTVSQNKWQLELSENQAVCKSNNQGFTEATFFQMGAFSKTGSQSSST